MIGEYILQLRREIPSHIIAPASHPDLPTGRAFRERCDILTEASARLRGRFLADVAILGALAPRRLHVVLLDDEGATA